MFPYSCRMVRIRQMTGRDIELGLRLKDQAGWNQTPADWRRFLDLGPEGCFVAELHNIAVATTTTCLFGTVGWIAMVLVEESARNLGIGRRLVEHAVSDLLTRGARTVRLDATPQGQKVYDKLGFTADYELVRMQGTSRCIPATDAAITPMTAGHIAAVARFDAEVTATERQCLLERLLPDGGPGCGAIFRNGMLAAYAMSRPGSRAATIGPAAATSSSDAEAVLNWVLGRLHGQSVFIDVPSENGQAVRWAASRGLGVQRHFLRMHLGMPIQDKPDKIWASSGPEKG